MKKEWYIVTAKCKEQKDVFVKNIYGFNPYHVLSIFMQEILPTYAETNSLYTIKIELDQAYEPGRHEVLEELIRWIGCGYGWQYVNPKTR